MKFLIAAVLAWQTTIVSADSAAKHVGQTATVEGTVANVKHAPKNASKFPDVDKLMSHKAKVTGKIVLYRGKPEIVVEEASQLVGE